MKYNIFLDNGLIYHRLDVYISCLEPTRIDAWWGAVLRNNLLFAAESVNVKDGITLREIMNQFPLGEEHFLYKELEGGFPKGFSIALQTHSQLFALEHEFLKGEKICFSLMLIGDYADYYKFFIEAIERMCVRGMGHPISPFELIDIYEVHPKQGARRIKIGGREEIEPLRYPVSIRDFIHDKFGDDEREIGVYYETPTLLMENEMKKNERMSYQDKLNGFPSFYQFVRSVVHRIVKLTILYAGRKDEVSCREMHEQIDAFVQKAAYVTLQAANVERIVVQSTRKKDKTDRIVLSGYVGETVFEGFFNYYLPLLLFAQDIGVGNDTTYALGKYQIFRPNNNI